MIQLMIQMIYLASVMWANKILFLEKQHTIQIARSIVVIQVYLVYRFNVCALKKLDTKNYPDYILFYSNLFQLRWTEISQFYTKLQW